MYLSIEQVNNLHVENAKLKKAISNYAYLVSLNMVTIAQYRECLQEIKNVVADPCIEGEDCFTCDAHCLTKDVLQIINRIEV